MALIRLQPREAFGVEREIDNLINRFWGDVAPPNGQGNAWYPSVDVEETENTFVVHAELPGVKREDIKVGMEKNVLTIEGERKIEAAQEGKHYTRRERAFGSFKRSFTIGTEVDADKITAEYKDGILTVRLPKAEKVKPRQIEVSVV